MSKGLKNIIKAKKCRLLFERYLDQFPTSGHPTDIRRLENFICTLSTYTRKPFNIISSLETWLKKEKGWEEEDIERCIQRIEIGLNILETYKKKEWFREKFNKKNCHYPFKKKIKMRSLSFYFFLSKSSGSFTFKAFPKASTVSKVRFSKVPCSILAIVPIESLDLSAISCWEKPNFLREAFKFDLRF